MYKSATIISLLPLLATLTTASPTLAKKSSGPSINVIFFSDNNCTTTVPPTIYTRQVYGSDPCHLDAEELYQSLIIDEIDDQFIGTNTALQVGNSAGSTCDFSTGALKYSVATRETVGECQFIGIPGGMGVPLKGGNEYVLTSLE